MTRFITYWIALSVIAIVTTYGGLFFVMEHIDLSFLQFATVLCAPFVQAMVLAWRHGHGAEATALMLRAVVRHPLAQPVLVLDLVLLGSGLAWWDAARVGLGAAVSVQSTWTIVKAVSATGFLLVAGVRRTGDGTRLAGALRAMAPVPLLFALDPSTSWLAATFAWVRTTYGDSAEVLRRLLFYTPSFALLVTCALAGAAGLVRRSVVVARLLHALVGAALVVALAVVLATFNLPVVVQPYLGVATLAASIAATCALLAGITLATTRPPSPTLPQ